MTKKHFTAIATEIRQELAYIQETSGDTPSERAVVRMARRLASVFKAENPRFDSERFYKACGL